MAKGRQIRIYLAEGTVTGIRHAEIMGWTGQALALPRNRVKELTDWEESQRPGIYFLFGINSETGNNAVYIGEAEQVSGRIQQHLSGKDFWNEVVCFTNKDENLTKAHVKYLESRLVAVSNQNNRYELLNGNQPPQAALPRGDKDVMEDFIENIRILIGALGYKLLEPLIHNEVNVELGSNHSQFETFTLKTKKYNAKAKQTNEGIVVLKGSEASLVAKPSLSKGYSKFRASLIDKNKLKEEKDKLIFSEDVLFASPSQAAAIIVGTPCNGLEYWLSKEGMSLKQKELEG